MRNSWHKSPMNARSGGKAVDGVDVFHLVYTCLIVLFTIFLLVVFWMKRNLKHNETPLFLLFILSSVHQQHSNEVASQVWNVNI